MTREPLGEEEKSGLSGVGKNPRELQNLKDGEAWKAESV
jgi:hypothetical protein